MRNVILLPLFSLLSFLLTPTTLSGQEEGLPIGTTPDPVILHDLDGDPYDLGALMGEKPILLEFWATWCTICRALDPVLHEARRQYGDDVEFVIVAVGVAQTLEQVRSHTQRHAPPGTVLWDGRGEAVRAFEAPGTGFIVLLDAQGTVAYIGTGPGQDVAGALRKVLRN